ncbi:MAG: TetR/AcrR family transcriptional regulator [Novosphingobium sp.]
MDLESIDQSAASAESDGPARRMGVPGSANWSLMLDAAETILCEEGYGALSSRRVADKAGFKQRLVYYYFHTMADLAVEMFRRMATRELARIEQAAASPLPLRALWSIATHSSDPRLTAEFMVLANRNPALKEEVVAYVAQTRTIHVEALTKAMKQSGAPSDLTPEAVAVMANNLALALTREAALGIAAGHGELAATVSRFLDRVEPL